MTGVRRSQRGTTAIIVALTLTAMFTMVAFAIDLSILRDDRRADQKIADAAAAAGAHQLTGGTGRQACEMALEYLERNTPGVASFSGADCSPVPIYCNPATPSTSVVGTAGPYRIEIAYPVPNDHPTMLRASAIGAPSEALSPVDGSNCDRLSVQITYTRAPAFAGLIDQSDQSTTVHAVARANTSLPPDTPINLLILERTACDAVVTTGNGKIIIAPITDTSGVDHPGILAVDSDGSGCGSSSGTVRVDGSNSLVRADGPAGCPWEVSTGPGHGCGYIELLAPGVPGPASPLYCAGGAYRPACDSTGTLRPHPVRMAERRTREPIDHHWDCRTLDQYDDEAWFAEHPIEGCADAGSRPAYVKELLDFVGDASGAGATPTGFDVYGDDSGTEPCTVEGGATPSVTVPEGNTRVMCPTLTVKKPMTFSGGNVIFDGDVEITGNGSLTINACAASDSCALSTLPFTAGDDFVETSYANGAGWIVFRSGGSITKDGGGELRIHESTVFLPANASTSGGTALAFAGSGPTAPDPGLLIWTAPTEGPFHKLAMWSGAAVNHDFAGQTTIDMQGVYFAPLARVVYRGKGEQAQVQAQFISEKIQAEGEGALVIDPLPETGYTWPIEPRTMLIR